MDRVNKRENEGKLYGPGMAEIYDYLMQSVDYQGWCEYVEKLIEKYRIKVGRLLDLACGTGTSTLPFAQKGYYVVGVDYSEEMISLAREKAGKGFPGASFEVGDLRSLELQGHFSLALHYQDGLNYLLTEEELNKAFHNISCHLESGGYFIFDLNFPGFYSKKERESFWVDEENFTMAWESCFNDISRVRDMVLLVFVKREDGSYRKFRESHREKEHSREEVEEGLKQAGFVLKEVLPTLDWRVPRESDSRLTFVAQKA